MQVVLSAYVLKYPVSTDRKNSDCSYTIMITVRSCSLINERTLQQRHTAKASTASCTALFSEGQTLGLSPTVRFSLVVPRYVTMCQDIIIVFAGVLFLMFRKWLAYSMIWSWFYM